MKKPKKYQSGIPSAKRTPADVTVSTILKGLMRRVGHEFRGWITPPLLNFGGYARGGFLPSSEEVYLRGAVGMNYSAVEARALVVASLSRSPTDLSLVEEVVQNTFARYLSRQLEQPEVFVGTGAVSAASPVTARAVRSFQRMSEAAQAAAISLQDLGALYRQPDIAGATIKPLPQHKSHPEAGQSIPQARRVVRSVAGEEVGRVRADNGTIKTEGQCIRRIEIDFSRRRR